MSIDLTEMSSKLEKLDEMIDKLDSIVKESNPAADLPQAVGLIRNCQLEMLDMFHFLDSNNIEYWLEGKTLLAAWRNGQFLPWDTFAHIGMLESTWIELQESGILDKGGLKIEYNMLTSQKESIRGSLVPQLHVRKWNVYSEIAISGKGMSLPSNQIWPLGEMSFEEGKAPTPKDAIAMLKGEFGDNWKKVL